jgi:hypothetical protein
MVKKKIARRCTENNAKRYAYGGVLVESTVLILT